MGTSNNQSVERTAFAPGMLISPLEIIDLTVDGGALARHNGQVVFLDKGVPGDIVSAEISKIQKKILHANVIETLTVSAHTAKPWCPSFGDCGGCAWQYVSLSAQHRWKEKRVADTLSRLGGVTPDIAPIVSGEDKNFRSHMTYSFGVYEERSVVGFRRKGTQDVIPIGACGLQAQAEPILHAVQTFLDEHPELPAWQDKHGYWRFMIVHTPSYSQEGSTKPQCVVEFIVNKASIDVHQKVYSLVEQLLAEGTISGGIVSERRTPSALPFGEKRLYAVGQTILSEDYGLGQPFQFSSQTFMQTNTPIFTALLERAFDMVPKDCLGRVWDLYCGSGVIGQYLALRNGASATARLFGVDSEKKAIEFAAANARALGVPLTTYYAGRVEAGVRGATFQPDLVVLDPPRSGVEKGVLEHIAKSAARAILYISCDVATQARDIKRLGTGWVSKKSLPFDMFPGTPHIENMVLLTRKA